MSTALCVDLGSTFTKAAHVDLAEGRLLGTAAHRTTVGTDVADGLEACRDALPGADRAELLVCSSAGGGLRVGVVGNEELVTAEAGRRVALSSGGHVVAVRHGGLDLPGLEALRSARPDVLLLVGGTDGGNSAPLRLDAEALARSGWAGPVVLAGAADAAQEVAAVLAGAGVPVEVAANVVPRIGVLEPAGARRAIREAFLRHVIGGKGLSRRLDLATLVSGPTPDLVLQGVEVLAAAAATDVVVVDVGGATTDVHSVVQPDPEDAAAELGLSREVVGATPVTRTVEGDLGMRWSALTAVAAGHEAGLVADDPALLAAARRRHDDPGLLPTDAAGRAADLDLARIAATVALRRHAGRSRVVLTPEGRVVERSGTDLRRAGLLVGSGGVLRHGDPVAVAALLAGLTGHSPEGWQLPDHPRVVLDRDYVLAAVGLLAEGHPAAATGLARGLSEAGEGGPTLGPW